MRQAGILAAAGLIALEESPANLTRDHANALHLAKCLAELPGIAIDTAGVFTNIVIFDISELGVATAEFSAQLKSHGVLANGINGTHMRMVTHSDVSAADCQTAVHVVRQVIEECATPQTCTSSSSTTS
jgi:threonine aldolase